MDMYWLYIDMPQLALDIAQKQHSGNLPWVICDQQQLVCQCNDQARQQGIKAGQPLHLAHQLAEQLQWQELDPTKVKEQLDALQQALLAHTPKLAAIDDYGILICSDGMEQIYTTVQQQMRTLLNLVKHQRIRADICMAMSGPLAIWLGKARRTQPTLPRLLLHNRLTLPLSASNLEATIIKSFAAMGIETLEQLLQLPRPELNQRYGKTLLNYIDQCLGHQPSHYPWQQARAQFDKSIELNFEISNCTRLLAPIERLTQALERYLRTTQQQCQQIQLELLDREKHSLVLSIASRSHQHLSSDWLTLIQLRLETLRLTTPVLTIRLRGEQLQPLKTPTGGLWADASQSHDHGQLLDQLQQRLGPESIFRLTGGNTHLPEGQTQLSSLQSDNTGSSHFQGSCRTRPIWLLEPPQSLAQEPFEILDSPELIELYQEGKRVVRCYQKLRLRNGALAWGFYTPLSTPPQWWLHGYFS